MDQEFNEARPDMVEVPTDNPVCPFCHITSDSIQGRYPFICGEPTIEVNLTATKKIKVCEMHFKAVHPNVLIW